MIIKGKDDSMDIRVKMLGVEVLYKEEGMLVPLSTFIPYEYLHETIVVFECVRVAREEGVFVKELYEYVESGESHIVTPVDKGHMVLYAYGEGNYPIGDIILGDIKDELKRFPAAHSKEV